METEVLAVDERMPEEAALERAAAVVRRGGLVAFPTETVYGLGADALNEAAVRRIFEAKGRPADNPLIVHIASVAEAEPLTVFGPSTARRFEGLARRYWPGPLTVVVPKHERVPAAVSGGLQTVALRMPDHPVALGLIRRAGRPLVAPSANRSGRPSPTEASHVYDDLNGRIDVILDGGATSIGVESTVLDLSVDPPVVHRPGAVSVAALADALGTEVRGPGAETDARPVSPGVKYDHYAPATRCVLIEGKPELIEKAIVAAIADDDKAGKRSAVLATREGAPAYADAAAVCIAGDRSDHGAIARNIYRCLRRLDETGADIIYIEGIASEGFGEAIMNRLRRAAGYRIVRAL